MICPERIISLHVFLSELFIPLIPEASQADTLCWQVRMDGELSLCKEKRAEADRQIRYINPFVLDTQSELGDF